MTSISKSLRPAVAVVKGATAVLPTVRARTRRAERVTRSARLRPELLGLMAVAATLELWGLGRNGWANDYYSGAIRSMSTSWHAFLYDSFDPSGIMTVDKPPLFLWVQALSVRVFGYHPLSMLVPQALMGVATVALVYDLVRRRFGRVAGLVAGLVLATTPITVAIFRYNQPDALLILCCVAALWFFVRALEDGRTRWLVLAGAAVGLGFETKMGVALMVVPGIAAAWLLVAPRGRRRALGQLLAGGTTMAVVGLAWPLLMWLTPASERPWVSGTADNSIWSLILGYNGLGRLDGQAGGPGGLGGPGGPGGGGGGPFGGSAGPFRVLNASLGGQAGWLLGFALVSGVALVAASRLRRTDARTGWIVAVGGAFLVSAIAFSAAQGIFHPYYVSFLAPFSAALVGAGAVQLARGGRGARIGAALAVAAGVCTEVAVLGVTRDQLRWLVPLLVVVAGIAAFIFATAGGRTRIATLALSLGLLLVAPAAWAVQTLGHAVTGPFPAGGPSGASFGGVPGGPPPGGLGPPAGALPGGPGGAGPPGGPAPGGPGGGPFGDNTDLSSMLGYVRTHGGGTLGVSSQAGASSAIIASGANVAGLGGFSGRESEVSVGWFAGAVARGQVRWVVAGGGGVARFGPMRDRRVGSSRLMAAVAATCKGVRASAYGGTGSGVELYDCAGHAAQLAARG
ncbi:MAG: glycosyltransferase family 39 protein [Actinobacteria bacterium]|nr:glycosyltransferase family 39 protein [Actinomycetota bacterium]